jgi:hypothetical protein
MPRFAILVAVISIASLSCFAIQDKDEKKSTGDDPIGQELKKAKETYASETKASRSELLKAIDALIKGTAATGDLDAVEALRAEQAAFEKLGKLPTSAQLRAAVTVHEAANDKARESLRSALEKAIREYTMALKVDEAKAVKAELAGLKPDAPAVSTEPKASLPSLRFEYKEYQWAFGEKPVKMIHKDEGFCFLAQVWGINSGNAEKGEVYIGEDGYWYLDGTTYQGREFLKLKAMSVKVRLKE